MTDSGKRKLLEIIQNSHVNSFKLLMGPGVL